MNDPHEALGTLQPEDVPLLFWAGAGWAGAISTDRDNMTLVAELPIVEAMMRRDLELDEDFECGIIHEFFIVYEGERPKASGGSPARAKEHFARVVTLTGGQKASPFVALAESVAVRQQDHELFEELLQEALAIDPNAVEEWTLVNTVAHEKARWLLDQREELFLNYEENNP
jgi:hypothetical protein